MKKKKFNRVDSPKKKSKEKFWAGSGKFFIVLIILYLLIYGAGKILKLSGQRSDLYSRNDLEIVGNQLISNEDILHVCGFDKDNNKEIEVNIDSLAAKLMGMRYIKGISITRRPPKLLNITVDEYEPIAFIYGRGLNLIDGEGFLIPVPSSNVVWDLPYISGISQSLGTLGKKSTAPETYLALAIVHYLEEENPLLAGMISEINMSDKKSISLYLIKGGAKIRLSRENFYKELYVLKNYIANYLDWRELAKIDYIDLRFENQLIVKAKT
jgi:cell division septal protein FtsQ